MEHYPLSTHSIHTHTLQYPRPNTTTTTTTNCCSTKTMESSKVAMEPDLTWTVVVRVLMKEL